jgi:hypothetical protein
MFSSFLLQSPWTADSPELNPILQFQSPWFLTPYSSVLICVLSLPKRFSVSIKTFGKGHIENTSFFCQNCCRGLLQLRCLSLDTLHFEYSLPRDCLPSHCLTKVWANPSQYIKFLAGVMLLCNKKKYPKRMCISSEDLLQYEIWGLLFNTLMSLPSLKFACRHDGNTNVKKLKCYAIWWHDFISRFTHISRLVQQFLWNE